MCYANGREIYEHTFDETHGPSLESLIAWFV